MTVRFAYARTLAAAAAVLALGACSTGSADQNWGLGGTRLAKPAAAPAEAASAAASDGVPLRLGPDAPGAAAGSPTGTAAAPVPAVSAAATAPPPEPEPPASPLAMAEAARKGGDPMTAGALYRQILKDTPNDLPARLGLAHVAIDDGQTEEALGIATALWQQHPRDGRVLALMARIEIGRGNLAAASSHLAAATVYAPRDRDVLVARGLFEDLRGDHTTAQQLYRQAEAVAPGDVAIANNLAVSMIAAGRPAEAAALLAPLEAGGIGGLASIRHTLALAYGVLGRAEDARVLLAQDLEPAQIESNLRYYQWLKGGRN